jgi:hypothetical protein
MSGFAGKHGRKLASTAILLALLSTNFALWVGLYLSAGWLLSSISPLVMAAVP